MVVVAISGMPGAGNSTVAKALAKKLKLKYFSLGKYFKEHCNENVKETEKAIKVMETSKGSSAEFHHSVDNITSSLAHEGDIVIEGKLAIHMAGSKANVKIWLKALPEVRAKRYAQRDGIGLDKAMKELRVKEKMERDMWKKIYGFDYFTQEQKADIVIDTSDRTIDEIIGIILRNMSSGYKE